MHPRFYLVGILLVAAVALSPVALAQAQLVAASETQSSPSALITKEFGPGFDLVTSLPMLTGDFDGDGIEDAVFVVTGKNPMPDEAGHNYKVLDPYNSYFGFGDPKVTSGFVTTTAEKPKFLLVIHSWQAPAPKAKFVIINLPFEKLSTGSFKVKKKVVAAITAEEAGGVAAAVYWDGKRYKWEAYGAK